MTNWYWCVCHVTFSQSLVYLLQYTQENPDVTSTMHVAGGFPIFFTVFCHQGSKTKQTTPLPLCDSSAGEIQARWTNSILFSTSPQHCPTFLLLKTVFNFSKQWIVDFYQFRPHCLDTTRGIWLLICLKLPLFTRQLNVSMFFCYTCTNCILLIKRLSVIEVRACQLE